jgi:hypothetical protein
MAAYPLVVRNNVPLVTRGVMAVYMAVLALITAIVLEARPPQASNWYQLYLLIFWIGGLSCARWAYNQEAAIIRITNPGSIHVERGKPLGRVEHWVPSARFWIDEGKDDDGDAYFKLKMDAPGGPLVIQEGPSRPKLEALQARIEAAASPAATAARRR